MPASAVRWLAAAQALHRPFTTGMERKIVRGVIFDMDGTLTKSVIDFKEMRRRAGIPTGDILDVLETLPPQRREEACKAIEAVEIEVCTLYREWEDSYTGVPYSTAKCFYRRSREWRSCQVYLIAAFSKGVLLPNTATCHRGLITRNVMRSVAHFHQHHFFSLAPFFPALGREFTPYKPNPDAILHICREWGINSNEVVMVGDSAPDDVVSGNRAGAYTILLDEFDRYSREDASLQGELAPSSKIKAMSELPKVLEESFVLLPPGSPSPA